MTSERVPPASKVTRTQTVHMESLPIGARLAGRYRILDPIGFGGMGQVYRAHDEELGVIVALKVLRADRADDEEFRQRFRRELILARQVSHRNVVRIHDLGFDGEMCFLTMDYVSGRSLREVLERDAPLSLETSLDLLRQLLEALEAAHAEGIVHRDLKPANILIDDSGRLLVTDFGIARSARLTEMTRTGYVIGTLDYLSPEQARGERADGRCDLYAVGLIFHEMLTGELPFPGGTPAEVLAQRLSGPVLDPRRQDARVPPFAAQILRRCLAPRPDERYSDVQEALDDLEGQEAVGFPSARIRAWVWRIRSRPRRMWVAGTVLLLTGLVTVGWITGWIPGWIGTSGWRDAPRDGATGAGGAEGAATPAPARHAVAVLPLVDETGNRDLAWTSRGVAETLSSLLAESPDLRVVDSFRVLRALEDLELSPESLLPPEQRLLAELLEVDRLVLGRIRSAGGRVQLEMRLADARRPEAPGESLSAEATSAAGVFSLVDRLGDDLRRRLQGAGLEQEPDSPSPSLSSVPEAVEAYGKAMDLLLHANRVEALPLLEQAVAEDPGFAAAWARLAETYEALGYDDKALEAARRLSQRMEDQPEGRLAYDARARAAALAGDLERAAEVLGEMVERFPHDVEARIRWGEVFGEQGRYDRAEEVLKEVVREDPNHPRAWLLLGRFALRQGNNRRAVDDYLVRALVVQSRLGSPAGRAEALNSMGAALEGLGELNAAAERYREATALWEEGGDRRGLAMSLANLAGIEALRGDFDPARALLERAIAIRIEIGDRSGQANLENQLGILAEQQGRYPVALEHYRQGLQLRRELGDRRALAESHYNVGFAYYVLGQLDNAGVHWRQALDLQRTDGNRQGEALVLQGLGQMQLATGDWVAAQRSLLDALEVSREQRLRVGEAVSRGYLGRAAQYQGRFGPALASYRAALEILEELGVVQGLVEFRLLEAGALLEVGRLDEAQTVLAAAAEGLAEAGNREQGAELARLEGELSLARGDRETARASLRNAVDQARASGGRVVELQARWSLGRAAAAGSGNPAAELRDVARAADRLGHLPLRIESHAALAEALRAGGGSNSDLHSDLHSDLQSDLKTAEREIREALRLALTVEPYGRSYRLHGLLAEILADQGRDAEAKEEWALAARSAQRVRSYLDEDHRETFDRLPEVRSLVGRSGEDDAGSAA